MDKVKLLLADKLHRESERLPTINAFGEKTDFEGYEKTIAYLHTGDYSEEDCIAHDLLDMAVNDFETLCEDYEIER